MAEASNRKSRMLAKRITCMLAEMFFIRIEGTSDRKGWAGTPVHLCLYQQCRDYATRMRFWLELIDSYELNQSRIFLDTTDFYGTFTQSPDWNFFLLMLFLVCRCIFQMTNWLISYLMVEMHVIHTKSGQRGRTIFSPFRCQTSTAMMCGLITELIVLRSYFYS